MAQERLTRSSSDKIVAGVCGGLANYLEIDPVLVRLAFIVLILASGIGFLIYLILWIVMPEGEDGAIADSEVIQKNLNEFGESMHSGARQLGKPATIGIILILLGVYFLFSEIGLFHWISGAIFWPLLIIGIGLYMLISRKK
ncbi:MAG: PspC domain-containing protein [Candidatus Promineifilaceae bacterium]|jgi:phage shock protein C